MNRRDELEQAFFNVLMFEDRSPKHSMPFVFRDETGLLGQGALVVKHVAKGHDWFAEQQALPAHRSGDDRNGRCVPNQCPGIFVGAQEPDTEGFTQPLVESQWPPSAVADVLFDVEPVANREALADVFYEGRLIEVVRGLDERRRFGLEVNGVENVPFSGNRTIEVVECLRCSIACESQGALSKGACR